MAAARSALARISRRSCVSSGGSSAAAPIVGRVLETPQFIRPAAPRTLPDSSIRPATVLGNLQNWQRFSTEGREWVDPKKLPLMTEKARHVLPMLGKWSKDAVRNVTETDSVRSFRNLYVCSMFVSVASISGHMANIWLINHKADSES